MLLFMMIVKVVARVVKETMPERLELFRRSNAAQIHMFLRAESLTNGVLDMAKLRRVTDRVISAGLDWCWCPVSPRVPASTSADNLAMFGTVLLMSGCNA